MEKCYKLYYLPSLSVNGSGNLVCENLTTVNDKSYKSVDAREIVVLPVLKKKAASFHPNLPVHDNLY